MQIDKVSLALNPIKLAEAVGMHPDEWQKELLLSVEPRIIANCARQTGKTQICAVLALWVALTKPGSLILIMSPSLRQSGEFYKRIAAMYQDLGRPIAATSETALTLTLANKSRIVSLPGKSGDTVRGYSNVALLLVDEASRCLDSLYYSTRAFLAVSGGRLILLSTPAGTRGFYHHVWTEGENWKRFEVKAEDCPRIPAAFLTEEKAELGPIWYAQEYECTFGSNVDSYFDYSTIQDAINPNLEPLDIKPASWASPSSKIQSTQKPARDTPLYPIVVKRRDARPFAGLY
jgi:hypothetical protein